MWGTFMGMSCNPSVNGSKTVHHGCGSETPGCLEYLQMRHAQVLETTLFWAVKFGALWYNCDMHAFKAPA